MGIVCDMLMSACGNHRSKEMVRFGATKEGHSIPNLLGVVDIRPHGSVQSLRPHLPW